MLTLLAWYALITLIGWLAFPLAFRILTGLPDRGYTLSRAMGWLISGYAFWLLGSLGILQNNSGGVVIGIAILAGLSAWVLRGGMAAEMRNWIRERRGYLLAAEGVFLTAFCFWAFVRSANPDLIGTEKPMELAFINAILGSPNFPPHDPWLSGYAISYYYFGYVLVSMLIRLTGASSGVGFNLAIALIFGLTALGAYGLVYNLLALARKEMNQETGKPSLGLPSLGPFFILIFSNIEGFLEMLHARGLFWTSEAGQPVSGFWKWLDIQELTQPPAQPYTWMPNRPGGIVWWRASRVLGDYNLQGQFKEIIDEFPFFSYLLADMHPHVLAMPFGLMMVGVGLHVYLRREEGSFSLLGWKIPFSRSEFFLISILLGGMAFLNTWDILAFTALISGAIVVARVRDLGWAWSRLGEFLGIAILFGIFAVLLYTPFYLGFASQAGGILPSFVFFTRGVQLWVMFFPLLIPLLALLVYTLIRERDGWKRFLKGLGIAAIIVAGLWVSSYALSYLASQLPTLGQVFLDNLGASGISIFQVFRDSLFGFTDPNGVTHYGRFTAPGAWLTLGLMLAMVMGLLIDRKANSELNIEGSVRPEEAEPNQRRPVMIFWGLLVLVGLLLALGPEFYYLRDTFGSRMNTIFKFYYQAWLLWGIGAAFASAFLLQRLKQSGWGWLWRVTLGVVAVTSLAYPVTMLWIKTDGFLPAGGFTLDGNAYLSRSVPDEVAAIAWLRQAPPGVVAQAPGNQYHDEDDRLCTLSGDPCVLGWIGHELQWRGGVKEMGTRASDLEQLYKTNDWGVAREILQRYGIRYVAITPVESSQYRGGLTKFQQNLVAGFKSDTVTIYQVPDLQSAGNFPGTIIGSP